MKKYLLLILVMIFTTSIQSQILISLIFGDKLNSPGIEFGLEGGLNFSSISGFESKNMLQTFGLGFYFDIRLKNQISLSTGVLVKSTYGINKLTDNDLKTLDADTYTGDGTYRMRLSYFMVPILIRYKLKNNFYIEAGPQAGLMYKSFVEYNDSPDDKEVHIREFNKDKINKIDIGAMGGIGYILRKGTGMTIGIKYYYGFVDVVKNVSGTKNNSLFLKVNIPIGRGKVDPVIETR